MGKGFFVIAVARNPGRLFVCWLVLRSLVWVVAVCLSHPNAPLDLIEWLSWGHSWQWGYAKHPPLPAWLADAVTRITPGRIWPVYALSYALTALTLTAAWQMARAYLTPSRALLAVLALDGLMYFTNDVAEYSNNVVLNAGWAWLAVVYRSALTTGALRWWLVAGLIFGLMLLTKYTIGVLAVCLLLYTVYVPEYRTVWRRPGPYLAALVAAGIATPHAVWLVQNDFAPFYYASARSTEVAPWWGRVFFPGQFLGGQLLLLLPVLWTLWPMLSSKQPRLTVAADVRYLDVVVLGPVLFLVAVSVVTGSLLREIWGSPLWAFFGVWLVARFGRAVTVDEAPWHSQVVRRWVCVAVGLLMFTVVKSTFGTMLTGHPERAHFPGRALAGEVEQLWFERYGTPVRLVGGEAWRAGNIACYSPHRPTVYTSGVMGALVMNAADCPWTSDAAANATGAVIVWDAEAIQVGQLAEIRLRFPKFVEMPTLELPVRAYGLRQMSRVGVGFVPPTDHE